jgi:hypothetical protein|nr:cyclic-phosphate processing receiver domain-containing protein [Neorhizobium tomejilense]
MTWKLFLDDDCDGVRQPGITVENPAWRDRMNLPVVPPDTSAHGGWVLARDADTAISLMTERGMPSFISFDHDLADGKDAISVAKWMIERDLDGYPIPAGFDFEVHSGNPVGRRNIRMLLEGYLDFKKSEIDQAIGKAERAMTANDIPFSPDWKVYPAWSDQPLVIDEVLYHFDEPIFFSVRLGPQLLILQKTGLFPDRNLYFGSIVDPAVVEAMKENHVSVLAALTAGPMLVLELEAMLITGFWRVSPENLPNRILPKSGVCLRDYTNLTSDRFTLAFGPGGTAVSPE